MTDVTWTFPYDGEVIVTTDGRLYKCEDCGAYFKKAHHSWITICHQCWHDFCKTGKRKSVTTVMPLVEGESLDDLVQRDPGAVAKFFDGEWLDD